MAAAALAAPSAVEGRAAVVGLLHADVRETLGVCAASASGRQAGRGHARGFLRSRAYSRRYGARPGTHRAPRPRDRPARDVRARAGRRPTAPATRGHLARRGDVHVARAVHGQPDRRDPAVDAGRRRPRREERAGRATAVGGPPAARPHGGALPRARPGARTAERRARPHPAGVRQGAGLGVRGGLRHRPGRPALRRARRPLPRAASGARADPRPDQRPRAAAPGRRRRDRRPLELPADAHARRRAARARRRQRRHPAAGPADGPHVAVGRRAAGGGRASRRAPAGGRRRRADHRCGRRRATSTT